MHSILPMLSNSPVLTFSIAPYFVWVMLAVLLVAGLAIVSNVLRAEIRRSVGAGKERPASGRPIGRVLPRVERPVAA